MSKKSRALKLDKVIRFAPGRGGQPATQIWKVWAEGSELYAVTRNSGSKAKISVHKSGQIHIRLEAKDKELLAPPLSLSDGLWLHAIEFRFLMHSSATRPYEETYRGVTALLIDTPPDHVLITNLLVGAPGCPSDARIPQELGSATILWRTILRNGRPAILLARVLPMNEQNTQALRHIREEIAPKVNFNENPLDVYVEVMHLHRDPHGGNVLLVVPMGSESVRILGGHPPSDAAGTRRSPIVSVISPPVSVAITAPNGAKVATISLEGATTNVELKRDTVVACRLGTVTLTIDPQSLVAGSKFQAQPVRLACMLSVDGASPQNWQYTIASKFDGQTFVAEFRQLSTSLRPVNSPSGMPSILNTDEIIISVPQNGLRLTASLLAPSTLSELVAQLLLREA